MTELSRYVFDVLRRDEGFVLYRGRNNGDASQVLVVAPAAEYPTAESLKQLEHEYSLREELDHAIDGPEQDREKARDNGHRHPEGKGAAAIGQLGLFLALYIRRHGKSPSGGSFKPGAAFVK